jgi:hypothetical protein
VRCQFHKGHRLAPVAFVSSRQLEMRSCVLLLVTGLLLAACRATPTAVPPTPAPTVQASAAPQVTALVIPTPSAETGVVTGQIIVRTTEAPLAGHIVYLAEFVPLEPGPAYSIVFKEQESPHIASDS